MKTIFRFLYWSLVLLLNCAGNQAYGQTTSNAVACVGGETAAHVQDGGSHTYTWYITPGTNGTDYTYTTSPAADTIYITWKTANNYTVEAHFTEGISTRVYVNVKASPVASLQLNNNTICANENANFTIARTDPGYVPGNVWTANIRIGTNTYTVPNITTTTYQFSTPVTATGTLAYALQSVTDNSLGCANYNNPNTSGSLHVIPVATVTNVPANYTLCSGQQTTPVTFTGTATSYVWDNHISSGVSGIPSGNQTGSFGSYTVTNPNNTAGSSLIRVTPVNSMNGVSCPGNVEMFTINVNPVPVITTNFTNLTICSGSTMPAIPVSGTASRFDYTVTGNTIPGLPASGSVPPNGTFGPFTLTNTSNSSLSVTVTITPVYNDCNGVSKSFTITVNPAPSITLTSPAGSNGQEVCLNSGINNIEYI